MSLSDKNPNSFVLSVEEVDLPATLVGIVGLLRKILSKPFVQSISLQTGQPIKVAWYKDISDSLAIGEPEESPDSVLSRIDLDEFSTNKGAKETLVDAIMSLNQRNLFATHVFSGSEQAFKDWFGIPSVLQIPAYEGTEYQNFLGLKYLETDAIGHDVVVLLAGETPEATLTEATMALKIVT
jgi:hypothetical protein